MTQKQIFEIINYDGCLYFDEEYEILFSNILAAEYYYGKRQVKNRIKENVLYSLDSKENRKRMNDSLDLPENASVEQIMERCNHV